ncbi:MAG: hypothetical protein P8X98_15035, partial [Woeseiaceae bacterium]
MSASTYKFAGVELDASSRSLRAGDHRSIALDLTNLATIAASQDDFALAEACRLWLEVLPQLEAIEHGAAPIVQGYVEDSGCSASTEAPA